MLSVIGVYQEEEKGFWICVSDEMGTDSRNLGNGGGSKVLEMNGILCYQRMLLKQKKKGVVYFDVILKLDLVFILTNLCDDF